MLKSNIVKFMAGTTKLNEIIKVAPVFPVYVRPLNDSRLITLFATTFTFGGFAFLSSYPLMQATVAHILPLPSIVLLVLYLSSLNFRPLPRSLVSLFESTFLISHYYNCRGKFGTMQV